MKIKQSVILRILRNPCLPQSCPATQAIADKMIKIIGRDPLLAYERLYPHSQINMRSNTRGCTAMLTAHEQTVAATAPSADAALRLAAHIALEARKE